MVDSGEIGFNKPQMELPSTPWSLAPHTYMLQIGLQPYREDFKGQKLKKKYNLLISNIKKFTKWINNAGKQVGKKGKHTQTSSSRF